MKKIVVFALCAMFAFALAGCASGSPEPSSAEPAASVSSESSSAAPEPQKPAEPLDLTGTWIATNSASEDSGMEAVIEGETITVYWTNAAEQTKSLYWAGTYVAPTEATESYSWDSTNDTEQTENALLASSDATKTFMHKNGVLSCDVTALGTTKTVTMERTE